MPRVPRAPIAEAERVEEAGPLDMDEPAAEEEEFVTKSPSCYQFLCDEMSFFRFEIADQRREAL